MLQKLVSWQIETAFSLGVPSKRGHPVDAAMRWSMLVEPGHEKEAPGPIVQGSQNGLCVSAHAQVANGWLIRAGLLWMQQLAVRPKTYQQHHKSHYVKSVVSLFKLWITDVVGPA